jgi:hypothetical protein
MFNLIYSNIGTYMFYSNIHTDNERVTFKIVGGAEKLLKQYSYENSSKTAICKKKSEFIISPHKVGATKNSKKND